MKTTSTTLLALAGLAIGVASAASVLVAGVGYRNQWWSLVKGFQMAEWAVYASALGLVLCLASLLRSLRHRSATAMGLAGAFMSLAVLGMALQWEIAARIHPPINDISTDVTHPPEFWDMPNPMVYPGAAVAKQQREAYPDLMPMRVASSPAETFELVLALIQERGWTLVGSDASEGRIEAAATSRWFGFTDEVAVRIAPEGGGSRVDMRSRSRLGQIDRGVNARRIRVMLADLKMRAQGR